MYLQILLLACLCFIKLYSNSISFVGLTVFILMEFGVLECQRRESKDAVLYQKSCLFACVDLFSAAVFLFYYTVVFKLVTWGVEQALVVKSLKFLPVLLLYILIRKIYILKNYSYEK